MIPLWCVSPGGRGGVGGPTARAGRRPEAQAPTTRASREPVLVQLDGLRRLVPEHDDARSTVVTWTGCQFRFNTSVGSSSTLRVIIASEQGCKEGVRRGLNPSPRAPRTRVLPLHHGHHRKRGRIHRLRAEAEGAGVEPARLIARPLSRRVPSPVGWPFRILGLQWAMQGSNLRPPACHAGSGRLS